VSNAHDLLHDLGREARLLEPAETDIQAILRRARSGRRARRWSGGRPALVAAGLILVLILAATASVPSTRAAIGDAIDSFFGGKAPGHGVTGTPLTPAEMPAWMRSVTDRALVIAGSGENKLTAYREGKDGHYYCFLYGTGVGECADADEWGRILAQHPVVLRGPTGGRGATPGHDHPDGGLYGFTRGDVASVRLTFADRPAITASARNGGFAMVSDLRWKAQRLEALDADGKTISAVDVTDRFWGSGTNP
jgi:hypothetical protein